MLTDFDASLSENRDKRSNSAHLARTIFLTMFSATALIAVACTGHSESGGTGDSGASPWAASQSNLPGASANLIGNWYGVVRMIDPPEKVGPNPLGDLNPNLPNQLELPISFVKKNEGIAIGPRAYRVSTIKVIDWSSRVAASDHIQVRVDSVASSPNSETLWVAREEDFILNGEVIDTVETLKVSATPKSESYLLVKYRGKLHRLTDAENKALIDSYKASTELQKQNTGQK